MHLWGGLQDGSRICLASSYAKIFSLEFRCGQTRHELGLSSVNTSLSQALIKPSVRGSAHFHPSNFRRAGDPTFTVALSTRRSGYERLGGEPVAGDDALLEPQLARARSVPASIFGLTKKPAEEVRLPPADSPAKKSSKKSKSHPVFSLFDRRKSKKMTAKPEFARYMEYLKEGGRWDKDTDTPVIYYNKND